MILVLGGEVEAYFGDVCFIELELGLLFVGRVHLIQYIIKAKQFK